MAGIHIRTYVWAPFGELPVPQLDTAGYSALLLYIRSCWYPLPGGETLQQAYATGPTPGFDLISARTQDRLAGKRQPVKVNADLYPEAMAQQRTHQSPAPSFLCIYCNAPPKRGCQGTQPQHRATPQHEITQGVPRVALSLQGPAGWRL